MSEDPKTVQADSPELDILDRLTTPCTACRVEREALGALQRMPRGACSPIAAEVYTNEGKYVKGMLQVAVSNVECSSCHGTRLMLSREGHRLMWLLRWHLSETPPKETEPPVKKKDEIPF